MNLRSLLFESSDKIYEYQLTFSGSDRDNRISKLINFIKKGKKGILVFDEIGEKPNIIALKKIDFDTQYFSITYNYSEIKQKINGTINIKTSDNYIGKSLIANLKQALIYLGQLGNPGHSFSVTFYSPIGLKTNVLGWDGDGNDLINLNTIKEKEI